jgi:hypothetical protein
VTNEAEYLLKGGNLSNWVNILHFKNFWSRIYYFNYLVRKDQTLFADFRVYSIKIAHIQFNYSKHFHVANFKYLFEI